MMVIQVVFTNHICFGSVGNRNEAVGRAAAAQLVVSPSPPRGEHLYFIAHDERNASSRRGKQGGIDRRQAENGEEVVVIRDG